MFEFQITSNARDIAVRFEGGSAAVQSALLAKMDQVGGRLHTAVVRDKLNGQVLRARTRNLARAVFHRTEQQGGTITTRVGYDLAKAIYGRAQELGATITPTKGQFLAIPVGEALTASGVARISAHEFIALTAKDGGGWGGFTRSFVTKNKTAIMGVRKSGEIEPVFALKRSVTLPARPALQEALDEQLPTIEHEIRETVQAAVQAL